MLPSPLYFRLADHPYLRALPTRRSSDLDFWRPLRLDDRVEAALHVLDQFGFKNGVDQQVVTLPEGGDRKSTSELQSQSNLVCRLLLEKKNPEHGSSVRLV